MGSQADIHDDNKNKIVKKITPPVPESSGSDASEVLQKECEVKPKTLYEKYGTNEPYVKPEGIESHWSWSTETFFEYA